MPDTEFMSCKENREEVINCFKEMGGTGYYIARTSHRLSRDYLTTVTNDISPKTIMRIENDKRGSADSFEKLGITLNLTIQNETLKEFSVTVNEGLNIPEEVVLSLMTNPQNSTPIIERYRNQFFSLHQQCRESLKKLQKQLAKQN